MSHASRRRFIQAALGASAGLTLAGTAPAIEPFRRNGKPHFRLSIAAYSYRQFLAPKGGQPTMTLGDFAELAAGMDLDAVEPTSYYFPKDVTAEYLANFKGQCTRLGLDVSGSAVGNNFCTSNPAKLKEQLANVNRWTEYCSLLGAKTLRIFAGNVEKGDSEEKARQRCVETIKEACDHAAKYGVYMALENHGGITGTVDQILEIVKAVKHDWFGVNLDTGNFHSEDPYADIAKLAPYAVTVQVKTEIQRGKKKEDADLRRLIGILRDVNYRGYVALEYEAADDPKTAIPRHVEELKKLVR